MKYLLILLVLFFSAEINAQTQPFFGNDIFNKDTNGLVKAPLTNNGSKVLVDSGWVSKATFLSGVSVIAAADSLKISGDTISIKNSNSVVLPRSTFLYTTVAQANSTTTLATINALQFNCLAGRKYRVKIYLLYNSASTATGIALRMNAFTGNIYYNIAVDNSLTGIQAQSGFNNIISLISTASASTTGNIAIITADLECTTTGLFSFSFASEVAGSAITIQPSSRLEYELIY